MRIADPLLTGESVLALLIFALIAIWMVGAVSVVYREFVVRDGTPVGPRWAAGAAMMLAWTAGVGYLAVLVF
jgi:hypothetical protein